MCNYLTRTKPFPIVESPGITEKRSCKTPWDIRWMSYDTLRANSQEDVERCCSV